MNRRGLALFLVSLATLIYGVNYTVAKEVMPLYIKPYGFILIRITGALLVFWTIGLFIKAKPIEKADFKHIALCAFFGLALNMLTFFKGLSFTTPISASVIMVTTPILVLIFSSFLIKERLVGRKILGILIGLIGAVILILFGNSAAASGDNVVLGNFLIFVNAASYALYLVIVKQLIAKYNSIVLIKWLYVFGWLFVLPFGLSEFLEVDWQTMPTLIYGKAAFVVVFATCVTFLCNLFALSTLKSTTVSVFIYLQPVVASLYALLVGSDSLDMVKIIATLLIFVGVYLVSKQVPASIDK